MLAATVLLFAILPQTAAADPTLPPAGAPVLFSAIGTGVQIYLCVAAPQPHWNLQAPQATLTDATTGKRLGRTARGRRGRGPTAAPCMGW